MHSPSNMDKFHKKFLLSFFITCSLIIHAICAANDTLNIGQTIRDGETLVSSGGIYELGFFTPGNSGNRYVGMWYKNKGFQAVIWIANRQVPLTNKSGVLTVIEPGLLVLLNDTGGIIWSTSTNSSTSVQNPVAQLLDSGNLIVKDANDGSFMWQSFDYPSDTYLPGMKLGWNYVSGVETYLSSWTSNDDPSPGEYTLHLDPTGYPQVVVKRGEVVTFRAIPWNELQDSTSRLTLVIDKNEVTYREDIVNGSDLWRSRLSQRGVSQRFTWNNLAQDWLLSRSTPNPGDTCDPYNLCGAYGVCDIRNSPVCGCLENFVPNGSTGCIRRTPLNCTKDDVFLKYSGMKLPDSKFSLFNNQSTNIEECRQECSRNCSCMAYTQLDLRSGGRNGCLLYHGNLIDIKNASQGGQDLYIRMDLENVADESKGNKKVLLIVSLTSGVGAVFLVMLCFSVFLYTRKRKKNQNIEGPYNVSRGKDSELPFFKLSTILKATDNFSINNRLGEGGFGAVYKGMLDDGEEVAVKRLSKTSAQGVDELKNEVILIAKLQHRNLVRLLGCCVEGEENMLIYEYMPNKSLNLILFDQTKSMLLDWRKRFNIINGIAKGLLYLHQDSRLRIIHRDLKASNILLDSDMNPRISDFGLARIVRGNETEVRTHRVVGTYGYMSPEYAADGLFSVKSDVFSFGVLVIETVSGKRNRGFSNGDQTLNLIGYAWKLDKEGNTLKIVDSCLGDAFDSSEVLRAIHVALLCVQKSPEDRPNMSSVVFMLGNEVAVPQAKEPGFYTERDVAAECSTSISAANSHNEVSITCPEGR